MKMMDSRRVIALRVRIAEVTSILLMAVLVVADEVFDIPHVVFGAPPTPVNWVECALEISVIFALGTVLIWWNSRLLRRLKMLENLLPVCITCKKIRRGEAWVPLEEYLLEKAGVFMSHGYCPECAKEYIERNCSEVS